ncbi:aftiphilin isoform X2 [Choristoneura fumiferana]|uniref:aftiphilin isoform X2 n=1 Tax=Choristoneura fumiferana TaxID=7141 RepID=UPI003D1595AF
MSIPPLVCSTPPPPDQCEDDKDPEDFDLQYNLSQDDEYDYGSFSTYNHFQSAVSNNKPIESPLHNRSNNSVNNGVSTEIDKDKNYSEISQWTDRATEIELEHDKSEPEVKLNNIEDLRIERIPNDDSNQSVENKLENKENDRFDKKLNNEEEINIEDLNLTVEEEESSASSIKNEGEGDRDSDKFDSSDKDKATYIPDDMISSIDDSNANGTAFPVDDIILSISNTNIEKAPNPKEDQMLHPEDESDINNRQIVEQNIVEAESVDEMVRESSISKNVLNELNNDTDDDFGDFTDFNFTSNTNPSTVLADCDNPWENNQPDPEFGAFEAHFDEAENTIPPPFQESEDKSVPKSQTHHIDEEDDDDFGDFDDFKSSMQDNKDKEEIHDPLSHVQVLDIQTSENESQILENINKILHPIFQVDVPEPESTFDSKLEALLCETWGHLLETDVRQPYIVNWNSSFGQKILLKALCIDSRNILFGPKWSYNMPKYAANLSAAPLLPQKQSTPSGPSQSEVNSEKNTTKPTSTWSDPFTSDSQEFSNKENDAVAPKRPTELDVFESTLSTKPDKIYSSTLDVQPLRQINLPDTHIFTPTDSETPRSKTIHYDGLSIFMSQSSIEDTKKSTPITLAESPSNVVSKSLDDGDYSDFQDFKGSFSMPAKEVQPKSGTSLDYVEPRTNQQQSTSATYSIGILQPIKIEPTMPTLNWPSPGEVKETFDDFAEFTSHSTWNNGTQEIQTPNIELEKTHNLEIDNLNTLTNSTTHVQDTPNKNDDSFDDDFDTFQSALPISKPIAVVPSIDNFSKVEATIFSQNDSTQLSSKQQTGLDVAFPPIDNVKSDAISLTRPNDILKLTEPCVLNTTVENTSMFMEPIVKIPAPQLLGTQSMTTNVLQPTVTSSPIQPNSTQILQPLSLESFSQINWPNPGINLQDLSRFNPVETLNSLKTDLSVSGNSKGASPVHHKSSIQNHPPDDDIWGEFVSSKPKPQQSLPKKVTTFGDDDEWTDFVSSPTVPPQNGVNTISFNVHTNLNLQKSSKQNKLTVQDQALDIPSLNYITPKSNNHSSYSNRHFQNL